jgi:hypothetical protein
MASKKAAARGHAPGTHQPSTPSQGTGSYAPDVTGARVIAGADRPGIIVGVPQMAPNSKDGRVTTPRLEDSQGWYRNRNTRQVES